MNDPVTRCPGCLVAFRISHAQLQAADGLVRCGACLNVFNAREHFTPPPENKPPQAPQTETPAIEADEEDEAALIDDQADLQAFEQEPTHTGPLAPAQHTAEDIQIEEPPQEQPPAPELTEDADGAPVEDAPEEQEPAHPEIGFTLDRIPGTAASGTDHFLPEPKVPPRLSRHWLWWPMATTALLAIGIQYLHFHSDLLGKNSTFRPGLQKLCALTGCKLPSLAEKSLIKSTQLVVRSHPANPNAMLVDIVIVNQAPIAQPFPNLLLSFQDINGKPVAQRQFAPEDYLLGELKGAVYMPSNQSIRLELEIIDPGETAVSYTLAIL